MEVPFTLTRANFVDIMSGIFQFVDEKEYSEWMNDNFNKFRICSDIRTHRLVLVNLK